MISTSMEKAIIGQINAEFYSAYLYLAMSAYFEGEGLPGMASWMKNQVQEEMFHGMKMYDYVHERGGKVVLSAIDKPPAQWKSPLAVFEGALAHEQKVTGLINQLANLALDERDHATNIFLQWFVSEQVEEEATVSGIIHKLKRIGKEANSLFTLDQELGQRMFTMPTPAK